MLEVNSISSFPSCSYETFKKYSTCRFALIEKHW